MEPAHRSRGAGPDDTRAEYLAFAHPQDDAARFDYRMLVSSIFAALCNAALLEDRLPDEALKYRSIPLFKEPMAGPAADLADPGCYHFFMTIGNAVPKVLELVLGAWLMHWETRHDIIGPEQIGFMPHHGCEWHVFTLLETRRSSTSAGTGATHTSCSWT